MVRSDPPMVSSFIAELTRRLKGQGPSLALPLTWIEQQLSESGLTIEQVIQSENQQQAADQLSISNSIGSLRFLGAMDWRKFVETMSIVEQTLREDPAGTYSRMDFATRDQYRHVVEKIAKGSPLSENEVAQAAIRLAGECRGATNSDGRESHVGFYLIDKGLGELERLAGVCLSFTETLRKAIHRFPLAFYLGTICIITAIFTGYSAHGSSFQGITRSLAVVYRYNSAFVCKPAGDCPGKLAYDPHCSAPSPSSNGLLQGNSTRNRPHWS